MIENDKESLEQRVILVGLRLRDDPEHHEGPLAELDTWDQESVESTVKAHAEAYNLKLGMIAQPLRAALTGSNVSPGIFEVAAVLGKNEALGRIEDAVAPR